MNALIKKIVLPEFVEMPKDYVYEVKCDGCGNVIKHRISDWHVIENMITSYDISESNNVRDNCAKPLWMGSMFLGCPLCHNGHAWTPELIEELRPYVDASKKYKVYSAIVTVVSSILLNCIPTANGFKLKPNPAFSPCANNQNAGADIQEVGFTIEWDDEISEFSKCMLMQKMGPFNVKDIVRHIKSIEFDIEIDLSNYYTYIPNEWIRPSQRPSDWENIKDIVRHTQPYYQVQSNCRVLPDYQYPNDSDDCDETEGDDNE